MLASYVLISISGPRQLLKGSVTEEWFQRGSGLGVRLDSLARYIRGPRVRPNIGPHEYVAVFEGPLADGPIMPYVMAIRQPAENSPILRLAVAFS